MSAWLALIVAMVYVAVRLGYQRAVSSIWSINAETLAHFVIVPLVQIAVLAVVLRLRRPSSAKR